MRIAIDLMGGDNAPQAVLDGIKEYVNSVDCCNDKFFLCGIEQNFLHKTYQEILRLTNKSGVEIIPIIAPHFITMEDSPLTIKLTKRNSTINKTILQLKTGKVDVAFSAGNSGATILTSLDHLSKKSKYPGLLAIIPLLSQHKHIFLMDVGASGNMPFKSEFVEEYLPLATEFYHKYTKRKNPRVGLLNVGEERKKGTKEHVKAYRYLEKNYPNFCGNIEGDKIFESNCHILLTGGFTGNIVLKIIESTGEIIRGLTKNQKNSESTDASLEKFSYEKIGGATLLGFDGNVVIGHGKSTPKAVKSALKFCRKISE